MKPAKGARASRSIATLVPLLIAAVALAGCSATVAGTPSPVTGGPDKAPIAGHVDTTTGQGGTAPGAAAGEGGAGSGTSGSSGAVTSGSSGAVTASGGGSASIGVAYPYPGSIGGIVAPEKTIVAVGTGRADARADGSDKASAQQKAVQAALADAKSQAQAVASAMGVTISGVYSVTVSASFQDVYPPMTGCAVPAVTPGMPTTGGPEPVPPVCEKPTVPAPTSVQVWVSVTVAYSFA